MLTEMFQNSQENTCDRVSFFIKKRLAQVFSCEFCETYKYTFFTEHLRWLHLFQDYCLDLLWSEKLRHQYFHLYFHAKVDRNQQDYS